MSTSVQECKLLGFDTIELNVGTLKVPEEALLRFVRLIKSGGLKAKPLFTVKVDASDVPVGGERAFGAYVVPVPRKSGALSRFLQLLQVNQKTTPTHLLKAMLQICMHLMTIAFLKSLQSCC